MGNEWCMLEIVTLNRRISLKGITLHMSAAYILPAIMDHVFPI